MFVAGASAQSYPPFYAEDVDLNQRAQWCVAQEAACPLLCYDRGTLDTENWCDVETVDHRCVCDDGKSPDLEVYSQTVPYFICTHQVNLCVDNCNGIALCATRCREEKHCGAKDPPKTNGTTTDKVTKPTASSTKSAADEKFTGGFGTEGSKSDSDDEESGAASIGKQYGMGLVIVGLGAVVTLFL